MHEHGDLNKASDSFSIESQLPRFIAYVHHLLLVTQIMPARIPLPGFLCHTKRVSLCVHFYTTSSDPYFPQLQNSVPDRPFQQSNRHSFQMSSLFLGGGYTAAANLFLFKSRLSRTGIHRYCDCIIVAFRSLDTSGYDEAMEIPPHRLLIDDKKLVKRPRNARPYTQQTHKIQSRTYTTNS